MKEETIKKYDKNKGKITSLSLYLASPVIQ